MTQTCIVFNLNNELLQLYNIIISWKLGSGQEGRGQWTLNNTIPYQSLYTRSSKKKFGLKIKLDLAVLSNSAQTFPSTIFKLHMMFFC